MTEPTKPETPGCCNHAETSHFSCTMGSFCNECPTDNNMWEHVFHAAPAPEVPAGESLTRWSVGSVGTYESESGPWVKFSDVPAALQRAVEEERERCAKIAEMQWTEPSTICLSDECEEIAQAIRSGGEGKG